MKGKKFDSEKPEMYLLPPNATLEVGEVLSYGAKKYSPDNWKKVAGLEQRYTSAALRHILAAMSGEELDEETGLSHEAHAICCLLFILENRLETRNQKERPREPVGREHPTSNRGLGVPFTGADYEAFRLRNAQYKLQYN